MVTQSQSFESPRSLKNIQEDAVEHALAGRWEAAIEVNLEGLVIDSENVSCLNRLSKAYLELSRYKEARALLKKAV
jgi:tetratricopeptide (TPR) repeat protein